MTKVWDILGRAIWSSGPSSASTTERVAALAAARDEDGIAWLLLDKKDSSANTLSEEVLDRAQRRAREARARSAEGAGDPLGQAGGFIAGADIGEFRGMTDAARIEALLTQGHAVLDRLDRLRCRRSR